MKKFAGHQAHWLYLAVLEKPECRRIDGVAIRKEGGNPISWIRRCPHAEVVSQALARHAGANFSIPITEAEKHDMRRRIPLRISRSHRHT